MILKSSTSYWSTGITLTWHPSVPLDHDGHRAGGWSGELAYFDDGWVGDDNPDTGQIATEGTLRTRYRVTDGNHRTAISALIDVLIEDAKRLGIQLGTGADHAPGRTASSAKPGGTSTPTAPRTSACTAPGTTTRGSSRDRH